MLRLLRNLITDRTNNLFVQLFRYTFVGGVAFVVDFALLFILTDYVKWYYQWSAAVSFVAGLTVNYLLSIRWVFHATNTRRSHLVDFLLFAMVGLIGLLLNALIIYVCTELLGVYYLLSKIVSTIIVFLWNFLGRRYLLSNIITSCHQQN
jgi:putative flippase GtrA